MSEQTKEDLVYVLFYIGLFFLGISIVKYLLDGIWYSITINDTLEYIFGFSIQIDYYHDIFIVEKFKKFLDSLFDTYQAWIVIVIISFLALVFIPVDNTKQNDD